VDDLDRCPRDERSHLVRVVRVDQGQGAREKGGLRLELLQGAARDRDRQRVLHLPGDDLDGPRARIDHHHPLRGRGPEPPLDRRLDAGAGVALAKGSGDGEADHLVEAPGLLERGRRPGPNEDPRASLQLDVARRLELAVGGGDGVGVEPEPTGQGPHRGEALPGRNRPSEDLQLQLRQQLIVQGHAAFSVEDDVHGRPVQG
jgi:hypothetical protein